MGRCPHCARYVSTNGNRWGNHGITEGSGDYCMMSKQPIMPTGTTDYDYERRATIVTDLACQLRDYDTRIVWDYLTATSSLELQRMMMVALAAIPTDQSLRGTFQWVCDLPIARAS